MQKTIHFAQKKCIFMLKRARYMQKSFVFMQIKLEQMQKTFDSMQKQSILYRNCLQLGFLLRKIHCLPIYQRKTPVVFILWGNFAQQKQQLITSSQHFIIKNPHPSPFFWLQISFIETLYFTEKLEIDWQISNLQNAFFIVWQECNVNLGRIL